MKKIFLVGGIIVITIVAIFIFGGLRPRQSTKVYTATGTLSKVDIHSQTAWSFRSDFSWRFPFFPYTIRLTDIPINYQQDQLHVQVHFIIVDVIGTSPRDTIGSVQDIVATTAFSRQLVTNRSIALEQETINATKLHDEQVAEEQARQIWDPVLAKVSTTKDFAFHGITFRVPENMVKTVTNTLTTFTFPVDIPEGPYITFSTSAKTSDQLVSEKKANMSQFETVVQDTTKTINGISWHIFEQTTDFGINQVTWMAKHTPTVVVTFTGTRDDVAAVLLKIVESGR